MRRVLIITGESETRSALSKGLARYDLSCSFTSYQNGVREAVTSRPSDILLFEAGPEDPVREVRELIKKAKSRRNLPVIALIPTDILESVGSTLEFDDFVVCPYDIRELALRIDRLTTKAEDDDDDHERITCDGLHINLVTCEVSVEGEKVDLTFKEFELLKLLAGNPGRVYTREALLDKIWGYDYYGGDRTVDVHVRRLRSKIEDTGHTFIETIRNIGYRFKITS